MLSIYKPAENAPIAAQKRLICLKQKYWSKRGVPTTSTRCSDHLGRQFLITASTFPYSSKNSSAEHSRCINMPHPYKHTQSHRQTHTYWLIHTLTHSLIQTKHTHTHTHPLNHTYTHTHAHRDTHTLTHTGTCIKRRNMFGLGIFIVAWKGRGGDQEYIRTAGWGSWYLPFRSGSFWYTVNIAY